MNEAATVLGTADIQEILRLFPIVILPARGPHHRIDDDNSAIGIKNRDGQRAAFHRALSREADHAGVLLIEGMAQRPARSVRARRESAAISCIS